MVYTYTALFEPAGGGKYHARVPDLPGCVTTGKSLEDAVDQMADAMGAWLVVAEDENLPIPAPSAQSSLKCGADVVRSLVKADTVEYRARTETRSVRKNVSLPAWMASLADKRGISCSQVLREGLERRFRDAGA